MVSTSIIIVSQHILNATAENCSIKYDNSSNRTTEQYCNPVWDSYLCWPQVPSNSIARQKCPPGNGIDITKFAERKCSIEGQWEGRPGFLQVANGWTNYTPCYIPSALELIRKMGDDVELKMKIAERTRTLEMIGISISLTALVISLAIFCHFRSLRNNRTRIHKNLFIAIIIQVLIRLIVYLDQAIIRNGQEIGNVYLRQGIDNTPFVCEASYILLEYARTAMFMWMFIEGLYLHNVVTVTVFQGKFPHKMYTIVGWGSPILMTTIWAVVMAIYIGTEQKCWWGYNLTPYYWIMEGPRLTVILLNFIFLLNIIRVLVVKLRQSHTSEIEQVRKAVRAAVVLLPLLGITNLFNIAEAPLERTAIEFAIWSYTTHFFTSFQGFFIALIYCFLNGEVRTAIMKSLSVYMSLRGRPTWVPRRQSYYSAAYTAPETEAPPTTQTCNDKRNRSQNRKTKQRKWINVCFKIKREKKQPTIPPNETSV